MSLAVHHNTYSDLGSQLGSSTDPYNGPLSAHQFTSPGSASYDGNSAIDEYPTNARFQELQWELRSLLFANAQSGNNSATITRQQTPDPQENTRVRAEPGPDLSASISGLERLLYDSNDSISLTKKVEYIKIWVDKCAPWLDMFDQSRHFGLSVPILAQSSSAVLNAVLAVSARQNERHEGLRGSSQDSLEFYSRAISALTMDLTAKDPVVLVTACILCVLEMMSASPRDWRRHMEGCAALFEASGVNGFSGGLGQAVFWCYARMDLCGAIIADCTESTVLPIDKWVLPPSEPNLFGTHATTRRLTTIKETFLTQGRAVPDMYANYAVYLCAKVCDLLSRRTRCVELNESNGCDDKMFEQHWRSMWQDLQQWYRGRPVEMEDVKGLASAHDSLHFPRILFAHWAAISGNQLYHTACILLLDYESASSPTGESLRLLEYDQDTACASSKLWHARQVLGISLTNPHPGCLNNAIQPLYVAGRLFTHRSEQQVVIGLLNRIESTSGWGSRWRLKDLESAWGYSRSTFSEARR